MDDGAVLGFDVGSRRIGVAVGNGITGTASALGLIEVREGLPDWERFDRLLGEWRPCRLVVGDPRSDDPGEDPPARQWVRGFARAAAKRSGLPVVMVDERHSSREAAARFAGQRRAGVVRRRHGEAIDALAAVVIVERWLAGDAAESFRFP